MAFGEIVKKIAWCLFLAFAVNTVITLIFSFYYHYVSPAQNKNGIEYRFVFYYLYIYYFLSLLMTIFVRRLHLLILLLLHFYFTGITALQNNPLKGIMIMTIIASSHLLCIYLNRWTAIFKKGDS